MGRSAAAQRVIVASVKVSVLEVFATPGRNALKHAEAPSASVAGTVPPMGAGTTFLFSHSSASVRCGVSVSLPVQFRNDVPGR